MSGFRERGWSWRDELRSLGYRDIVKRHETGQDAQGRQTKDGPLEHAFIGRSERRKGPTEEAKKEVGGTQSVVH